MAKKIFISFLGTGFYRPCKYTKGDFTSDETRYIQVATLQYLKVNEWDQDDKILILLTDSARKSNWSKEITSKKDFLIKEGNQEVPYEGLETAMNILDTKAKIIDEPIDNGENEEEMWNIFTCIFNNIDEESELYIDLTHSFRYLPMLMLVLGNYAKFLKNVSIKHLSYGNYEARDKTKEIAPIVDLLPLSVLQDWTFAAGQFLESGKVGRMHKIGTDTLGQIIRKDGSSKDTTSMLELVKSLKTTVEEFETCRGMSIMESKQIRKIKQSLEQLNEELLPVFKPVLGRISSEFANFNEEGGIHNCFEAAKWCLNKGLFQQAITILEESLITLFCLRHNIKIDNEDDRKLINAAFTIIIKNLTEDQWDVKEKDKERVKEILTDPLSKNRILVDAKDHINIIRNDYNHSGFRSKREPMTVNKIKSGIQKKIEAFGKIVFSNKKTLINISNHPLSKWSEEQVSAGNMYGEIVDMPFPSVDPSSSSEEIKAQAKQIAKQIASNYPLVSTTVHVMGEMTLTYAIVKALKEQGFKCVASTTERISIDNADGTKTSTFKFKSFREYE